MRLKSHYLIYECSSVFLVKVFLLETCMSSMGAFTTSSVAAV